MQELPKELGQKGRSVPDPWWNVGLRYPEISKSRKSSQVERYRKLPREVRTATTRDRPLGTRVPVRSWKGATYFKWYSMAVVTLQGKSDIEYRVGISPHAFICGPLQGTQWPTFRQGTEAPMDLGRQHQPRPVPSEYGLGQKVCEICQL